MARFALRVVFLVSVASAVVFWPAAAYFALYDGSVEDAGGTAAAYDGAIVTCVLVAAAATAVAIATRRARELPSG